MWQPYFEPFTTVLFLSCQAGFSVFMLEAVKLRALVLGLCDYHPAGNLWPDKPKIFGLRYFEWQPFKYLHKFHSAPAADMDGLLGSESKACSKHPIFVPGKYLSSSPVGAGRALHWQGNAGECRAGGRWDPDGPAVESPRCPSAQWTRLRAAFCSKHLTWRTFKWGGGGWGAFGNYLVPDWGDCILWLMRYEQVRKAALLPWPVAKKCWNWDERWRKREKANASAS